MARLTSLLLLAAGALLLVTWLVSPASSSAPAQASDTPATAITLELDAINQEVDRLHERLAAPSSTVIAREPFQFTPPPASRAYVRSTETPSVLTPEAPSVTWPRLVAILSSGTDAAPVRQVVFEDANQIIQIKSEGESIDGVTVERITDDAVIVTSSSASKTTRLSIR